MSIELANLSELPTSPETEITTVQSPASERQAIVDLAARQGWRLIRVNGKKPLGSGWPDSPGLSQEEALAYTGNLGIICGENSNRLFVVDIDGEIPENLPETPTVITGSGGLHMYYFLPEGILLAKGNQVGRIAEKVDTRWTGGQVVAPSSIHPGTGDMYRWMPGKSPDDIAIAEVPGWIVEELKSPPAPQVESQADEPRSISTHVQAKLIESSVNEVRTAKPGTRNNTLNKSAYTLAGVPEISDDVIIQALTPAAMEAGLAESEARTTIHSGISAGRKEPLPAATPVSIQDAIASTDSVDAFQLQRCTDVANGKRFEEKYTGTIMHSDSMGWLRWDGMRFVTDPKGARQAAKQISQDIPCEIKILAQEMDLCDNTTAARFQKNVEFLIKWAKTTASTKGINSILQEAKTTPGINANHREFDADRWLLNCGNGTLDLRTGELLEHSPEYGITKLAPIEYDPGATCPRWDQFLSEIFEGDLEIIEYVRRALGYSLSGDTSWQAWFLLHGNGENGKSRFVDVLRTVLGPDYAQEIDPEELCQQKYSKHSTERAALRGARYLTSEETDEGRQLAESFVKALTGEGKLRARFMRQDSFEFEPVCKLWLSTNNKPVVKDGSHGFWRRVRLIPFNACFANSPNKDPKLSAKLKGEAPGILAQLVKYAQLAAQEGEGNIPPAIQAANEEYRGDSDILGVFLGEHTVSDPFGQVMKKDLYQRYSDENGGKCETFRKFNDRIKKRGIPDTHLRTGAAWEGLALNENFS